LIKLFKLIYVLYIIMSYSACPSCNLSFSDKQIPYEEGIEKILKDTKLTRDEKSIARNKLLEQLNIFRSCCKMRMISSTPIEKILSSNV